MMQSSANVSGQFIFIIFTTFWNTSRGSCRRHSFRERSMPGPWVCKDVGFCNLGRLFQLVNLPGKTNICVSICATQPQYFLLTQRCRRDTIQTRTAHQAESNLAWRQGNVKHVIPGRKALIDQVFPGLWLVDILYIYIYTTQKFGGWPWQIPKSKGNLTNSRKVLKAHNIFVNAKGQVCGKQKNHPAEEDTCSGISDSWRGSVSHRQQNITPSWFFMTDTHTQIKR